MHRNQRSKCQHSLDHRKSKRVPKKHLLRLYWLHQTYKADSFSCIFAVNVYREHMCKAGLPRWLSSKESACQCRRCKRRRFDLWVGKIPWRRKWQATPAFLPGKFYGWRSLAGYSPWGHSQTWLSDCACMEFGWFITFYICSSLNACFASSSYLQVL